MEKHMNLARVPEDEELEYVRDMLKALKRRKTFGQNFTFVMMWLIAFAMWRATYIGATRVANNEISVFPVIVMALFAFCVTALVIKAAKYWIRPTDVLVNYNDIKVWDVEVCDITRGKGRNKNYYTKVKFADGTVSTSQFQLEFYPKYKYTKALVVIAYGYSGKEAQTRLIPTMEDGE